MDSTSWPDLANRLTAELKLETPPIAITFDARRPEAVEAFAGPKPSPAPDGRTGSVPAGCVFWAKGVDRTFSTVASDHANCSFGMLVHGLARPDEVVGNSDLEALVDSGWVTAEQVSDIPVVRERPGSVTYGPLADVSSAPHVVLVRIRAGQLMVLADAVPGVHIGGKPQCHIVALAKEEGEVAVSIGCTLSRARTGMAEDEMTCAIPASRLAEVVHSIEDRVRIDAIASSYAETDIQRFGSG